MTAGGALLREYVWLLRVPVEDEQSRVYPVSTGDRNRRSPMNTTGLFLVGTLACLVGIRPLLLQCRLSHGGLQYPRSSFLRTCS